MYKFNKQKWLLFNDLDVSFIHKLRDNRAVIAGGAVRAVFAGETISDYDVYVPSVLAKDSILEYLEKELEYIYRLDRATIYLDELIENSTNESETKRLKGKKEGVELAKGYFLEMLKE